MNRRALIAAAPGLLAGCGALPEPARLVLWAWERPEDLMFAPVDVEVAVLTGFIQLSGARVLARGRRFPLAARPEQVTTSVVHVEIDSRRPLDWTPAQAAETLAAVLDLGLRPGVRRLQLDFEVLASQRAALMDLLRGLRARLPTGIELSMTALASWCQTESWLAEAPVDEIVPMLFRMGPGGTPLRAALAQGGDFASRRCRSALAISVDTPLQRAPAGRRVYLFSPRSWTAADFRRVARSVASWS